MTAIWSPMLISRELVSRTISDRKSAGLTWLLNAIDAGVPASKAVHVVLDNYAAHKHPKVRASLDRHQRFTFHFTPTS